MGKTKRPDAKRKAPFRVSADAEIAAHRDVFEDEAKPLRRARKGAPKRAAAPAADGDGPGLAGRGARLLVGSSLVLLILAAVGAAGAAVGGFAAWLHRTPVPAAFVDFRPPEQTTILDRAGEPLTALYEQRRLVIPVEALPSYLPEAFVAIEDARFYHHIGVDPLGVARAVVVNLLRGRLAQGGSTITQQTVRNVLPGIGFHRSLERKAQEALYAMLLERSFTKRQILDMYLNQIYLGSGNYGIESAAKAYFGKSAAHVDIVEAATLAGLPQLPERYSPLNDAARSRERRDQVLARMFELGIITAEEYDWAVTQPVALAPDRVPAGEAPYFVDAVRRAIASHPDLDGRGLHQAGWQVRTTVDPLLQEAGERILAEGLEREEAEWMKARGERWLQELEGPQWPLPPGQGQVRMARVVRLFERSIAVELPGGWRADLDIPEPAAGLFAESAAFGPGDGVDVIVTGTDRPKRLFHGELLPRKRLQGALVCLDAATGDVRVMVGGRDFGDLANDGLFNRAILARRQAGSTMKPFFFAYALERGLHPHSTVFDGPLRFADGYTPRNYENRHFGETTLEEALAHSRNIVTIKLVQRLGLKAALQYVASFQRGSDSRWRLPREWPTVLGTTNVTPLELAAAYQPFANAGLAQGPRLIEGVWNREQREALGFDPPEPEVLLSGDAAAGMLQMLAATFRDGTGTSLLPLLPEDLHGRIAGKSGTTNDNRDAWFAGFTPHDVIVVWVGFDMPLPLGPGRTGSRVAGPIFAQFAAAAWEAKPPAGRAARFKLPRGYEWRPAPVEGWLPEDPNDRSAEPPSRWRVTRAMRPGELAAAPH